MPLWKSWQRGKIRRLNYFNNYIIVKFVDMAVLNNLYIALVKIVKVWKKNTLLKIGVHIATLQFIK